MYCTVPVGIACENVVQQSPARLSRLDGSELAAAHASAGSVIIENTNYYGAKDLASSFRTVRLPSVVSPRHASSRIFLNESSPPFSSRVISRANTNEYEIGAQWMEFMRSFATVRWDYM